WRRRPPKARPPTNPLRTCRKSEARFRSERRPRSKSEFRESRGTMFGKWLKRLVGASAPRNPDGPPDPSRPNIVWLCADDFTPDLCGAYGNRLVRTPHLDRLAAQGIRFDRAYCACPLSTPSRQAFWTGRYPRSIGVTLSRTPLPDDEITLPTLL